jgi:integrase/recombinase XerD
MNGVILMAKLRLKTLRINNNSVKTISECYSEYMDYCKAIGQREGTLISKKRFYTYELLKLVKQEDTIENLTKEKIQKHINFMIEQGYKGNYYQTFVIKLRAFLTFCFKREYLTKFDVKIPNILLEKKVVYTEEEVRALLKKPNLNTCLVGDYRSWVMINFLLATGCRSETLLNVKVKDINFELEYILFSHMKTKRQVTVPLSNTLKVVLIEYISNMALKDEDILFPKLNGTKMSYDTLHQNLSNYFKHCKVKMRGINTFRNTFATMFIKNGGDIYRLKSVLSHSNIKTTERYVNLLPLELKEDTLKFNPLDVLSKGNRKIKLNK